MNPSSVDVKIEKANAINHYNNKLQRLFTTFFRFIEIIIFIVVISRLSVHQLIPFSIYFKLSSVDHLIKGISFAGLISSKYVFVLGNMIILILFFKSRVVENGDHNDKIIDVYDEYVKSCEKKVVNNNNNNNNSNERKIYRSQSGNMMKVECQDSRVLKKLRRSMTDKKMVKNMISGGDGGDGETTVSKDELSSDEFRRTVEAFIARQQRSLRDEESSSAPGPYVYIGA